VGPALAQTVPSGGPPMLVQLLPVLVLGVVFYLLLIRPEQRRRKEHEQLLAAVKRNDQIVLAAGIHGRVTAVGEKTLTVEIARGVQVQVERSAVQTIQKVPVAEGREKEREKS
jgi:preprotein translocase subunit YajC